MGSSESKARVAHRQRGSCAAQTGCLAVAQLLHCSSVALSRLHRWSKHFTLHRILRCTTVQGYTTTTYICPAAAGVLLVQGLIALRKWLTRLRVPLWRQPALPAVSAARRLEGRDAAACTRVLFAETTGQYKVPHHGKDQIARSLADLDQKKVRMARNHLRRARRLRNLLLDAAVDPSHALRLLARHAPA